MLVSEGGRHTRVELGEAVTYVSRHNEINEKAARAILKQAKGEQR